MKNRPSLDLHGRSKDEVFDLLDAFLREHESQEQVLVIVGIGRGLIKKEAVKYLEQIGLSWRHERDRRGLKNPGALVIDLY